MPKLVADEPTIDDLLYEVSGLLNTLSDRILGQTPIEVPDNTQELGAKYYQVNTLYNRLNNIFNGIRHSRELLKQALFGIMGIKGESTIEGPNGSKIRRQPVIYAKIEDKPAFIDWCYTSGNTHLLQTRVRKGSQKDPGIDHLVRTIIKRARQEGGEIVLPPGIEYSEPPRLVVTQPSESDAFDKEAMSIIERLRGQQFNQPETNEIVDRLQTGPWAGATEYREDETNGTAKKESDGEKDIPFN